MTVGYVQALRKDTEARLRLGPWLPVRPKRRMRLVRKMNENESILTSLKHMKQASS